MTTRERFNRVLHWQKPDRVPNMDFGYWDETIALWHDHGLPEHLRTNEDVERFLNLEGTSIIPFLPVVNGLFPHFEYEVLEEKEGYTIVRNEEGTICKVSPGTTTIPQYIRFGVETREDWKKFREDRLDYTRQDRIGEMKRFVEEVHASGMPVRFDAGSLYGWLRNWMGLERISIALMTERKWVEEMMEHLTEMTLYLMEKTLPDLDVDMAWWWEDMCYNHGPLISPRIFRELMVPRYKRITAALREYGIDLNILDCDGSIYELVPGWLEAGITGMFPIEVAHTDPLRLREEYGREVLLIGGVNKVALIRGKKAIDLEMVRLRPLVQGGGFIPTVDHRVPADVTFDNYLYYLERKKEILE